MHCDRIKPKAPPFVYAEQVRPLTVPDIEDFVGGDARFRNGMLTVAGPDGPLRAGVGDWIVSNCRGGFYVVDEHVFQSRYRAHPKPWRHWKPTLR